MLYVAATRARDLLVVPAVGDERYDGWLDALDPGPSSAGCACRRLPRRASRRAVRSSGLTPFGTARPARRNPRHPWRPASTRPRRASTAWCGGIPAVLGLGVQESVGLEQQRLLEADEARVRSEEGVRAHEAWQTERARVRARRASRACAW